MTSKGADWSRELKRRGKNEGNRKRRERLLKESFSERGLLRRFSFERFFLKL